MQIHDIIFVAIITLQGLLLFSIALCKGKEIGSAQEKKKGSLDVKVNVDTGNADREIALLQQRVEALICRTIEYNKIVGAKIGD